MLVAPDSNPAASFTPVPRLTANFARPGGFLLGLYDALINGIAVMARRNVSNLCPLCAAECPPAPQTRTYDVGQRGTSQTATYDVGTHLKT